MIIALRGTQRVTSLLQVLKIELGRPYYTEIKKIPQKILSVENWAVNVNSRRMSNLRISQSLQRGSRYQREL